MCECVCVCANMDICYIYMHTFLHKKHHYTIIASTCTVKHNPYSLVVLAKYAVTYSSYCNISH